MGRTPCLASLLQAMNQKIFKNKEMTIPRIAYPVLIYPFAGPGGPGDLGGVRAGGGRGGHVVGAEADCGRRGDAARRRTPQAAQGPRLQVRRGSEGIRRQHERR